MENGFYELLKKIEKEIEISQNLNEIIASKLKLNSGNKKAVAISPSEIKNNLLENVKFVQKRYNLTPGSDMDKT